MGQFGGAQSPIVVATRAQPIPSANAPAAQSSGYRSGRGLGTGAGASRGAGAGIGAAAAKAGRVYRSRAFVASAIENRHGSRGCDG